MQVRKRDKSLAEAAKRKLFGLLPIVRGCNLQVDFPHPLALASLARSGFITLVNVAFASQSRAEACVSPHVTSSSSREAASEDSEPKPAAEQLTPERRGNSAKSAQ